MASTPEGFEELVPSAARLTENLRDLGYQFEAAVADLVDNSISAEASEIDITMTFNGPESSIRIADNGKGMDSAKLSEAMRLGSHREYGATDLGKFGMGLKTASLSQARRLTVISKRKGKEPTARQLDLDHVLAHDRWEVRTSLPEAETSEALVYLGRAGSGTVILWEQLDRVLSFRDPWGGWAERHLLGLAERLELHLGMVFSRFIASGKLRLSLNGNPISEWDPFVRSESATEALPQIEVRVSDGLVRVAPFVLPPKAEFSSETAWRNASGPRQWNDQQGFYIYRADRLIQSGGWSNMRARDEHSKLARVAVEFWPDLDETFEINISKMRVKFPEDLREELQRQLKLVTARAISRYRGANNPTPTAPKPPAPKPGPTPPAPPGTPGKGGTTAPPAPPAKDIASVLLEAAVATASESALAEMHDYVSENFPTQARLIGW